jgi:hypothetical protein
MYPVYSYFPRWQSTPEWVFPLTQVFLEQEISLNTAVNANRSDAALEVLRPGLNALGFEVESSKTKTGKLYRPVLFGDNGKPEWQYQIDAYHPERRIALEVEAARSVLGNAIYRDLIQMSLLVDVAHAVVAVPMEYRYLSREKKQKSQPYQDCRSILDAIYGGRRLELPFEGFLLIGY